MPRAAKPAAKKRGPKPRTGEPASTMSMRLSDVERARYERAREVEGAESLSDWIRSVLDARAQAVGV
jgi:hypothetical protein